MQAQLIRRGGIRDGKMIPPAEIDGRVAQLREAAQATNDRATRARRRRSPFPSLSSAFPSAPGAAGFLVDASGGDRRAGAAAGGFTQVPRDAGRVTADQFDVSDAWVHPQAGARRATRGTVKGISTEDEELLLLARACDQYGVVVCL